MDWRADFFSCVRSEMKIVVFGNGSGFGGAQTAFRRLVDFLTSDGHEVGVIGLVRKGDVLPATGKTTFGLRVNYEGWSISRLIQTLRAARVARRFAPDLFVTVGLAKSAELIARHLSKLAYRIAQDFIFGRTPNDPLLSRLPYTFDALAVQAPSMIDELRKQGFNALPVSWLPCFPDPLVPGFRRTTKPGATGIRLAYFGRLAPNKGLDLLLHALAMGKFAGPVALDIWGNGSELERLEELCRAHSLGSVVNFCGRYPEGAEFARLICDYDALVLPSTGIEGLPLILLEAMAYGVPFLATRVGAIPDCCAHNEDAVLVDPSTDAIRSGLEQLVSRLVAKSFSTERLIDYYAKNFSYDVMASRWREMMSDSRSFFSAHV